ncbi:type II secretion system minor pseudopilin [Hyphobacterium marinum]|uniref:T2SS protein K first SAM-like domain-containing protein n=1 Tax=Hyphobacterium marinum TaxID=3116574 RepID=A0ABU7LVZ2_9PROT|nr:hypothetical protein [Hyphobacterium sp. Y6023]MEE2565722.1 hypothetical protein [Hyphobacterium sp. Y6023]
MNRRGYALLVVVAVLGVLSVAAGLTALSARTSTAGARADLDQVRYRAAIEAGAARAAAGLLREDEADRWSPDGRAYEFELDGLTVTVRPVAETGRFDLNRGNPETLAALLEAVGVDRRAALTVAGAVPDWRDEDDDRGQNGAEAPSYRAENLPPPGNRPFVAVEEFRRVLGVDAEIYRLVAPYLTIHGGEQVAALYAPPTLLEALDLPRGDASRILAARRTGAPPPEIAETGAFDPGSGARYALFIEVTASSGAGLARIVTVQLPGEDAAMDVLGRTPLPLGAAVRLLEPESDA